MKIWVLGRNYPELGNGISGSFEFEQAKMLVRYGNKVTYLACSLHPTRIIRKREICEWVEDGLRILTISNSFFPRVYPFYFQSIRNNFWTLLMKVAEEKEGIPEVIHIHYPSILMISDVLKMYHDRGVKIILTEHWTKVLNKKLDSVEKTELKKYFTYADTCICVGSPLANAVAETVGMTNTKIIVIPNIVNEVFRPTDNRHDGFQFVSVGRLVDVKQFDQIISAFAEEFKNEPVKLLIIGGGENKSKLDSQIKKIGVQAKVKLMGILNRKDTAEYVANADCLVCYSRFETFGVPIIEAWACGLAIITTTTTAAVIDNFDKRLGVKVRPDNYEGLKKAMRYLYEHKEEYDKEFIIKFAGERFSESAVYAKLARIYKE